MRRVMPRIFLVGETRGIDVGLNAYGLNAYLRDVGAGDWTTDAAGDGERLIEAAGRLCYRSWAPGLNPNVTKVREGNAAYFKNIIDQRHGSVMEHGSVSFIFHNVSRVFTHELVRHRAGCAISQESMRYVRLTDIPIWLPPETLAEIEALVIDVELEENDEDDEEQTSVEDQISEIIDRIELLQQRIGRAIETVERRTPEAMPMSRKKKLTSFMRRIAPDGIATGIFWTANFRTLRHVLELRTDESAEEEIRYIFDQVGDLLTQRYPAVFQDFTRTAGGVWRSSAAKI